VKRLTLQNRTEILPALHRRSVSPVKQMAGAEAQLHFEQRTTRSRRFPVEESLARSTPEPSWRGHFLDIEV